MFGIFFFFQAEDGIRDLVRSRGLGDVYKRQVHTYLKEIGQVPLLTAEQEIWLATQMQALRVLELSLIHI